jgi:predicted glutamine amidotransferase
MDPVTAGGLLLRNNLTIETRGIIMCLMIVHRKETTFSDAEIADFYKRNPDGVGVMVAAKGVLHVHKLVPTSVEHVTTFYKKYAAAKDCVLHFRMRTAGNVDIDNAHPYEVFGEGSHMPLYMAHNGVLSTGNHKDTSKSDTYWYIEDFVKPMLAKNPELVFSAPFLEVMAAHIGTGNKFVFMNHEGTLAVVNEKAFVRYKGSLMSNTYAWDYYGLHPDAKRPAYQGYQYGRKDGLDDWDNWTWNKGKPTPKATAKPQPKFPARSRNEAAVRELLLAPVQVTKQSLEDDMIAFTERALEALPESTSDIQYNQVRRLFQEFGIKDVETWLEGLEFGEVTPKEFVDGLKDPRKVRDWLNHPENMMFIGGV